MLSQITIVWGQVDTQGNWGPLLPFLAVLLPVFQSTPAFSGERTNEPDLGEPWGGEVPYRGRPTPGYVPEPPYPEPPPSEYNVEDFDAISHRGDEPERGVGNVVFGQVRRDPLFDRLRDGTRRAQISNHQNRMLMQHIEADQLLETTATFQQRMIYSTIAMGSIAASHGERSEGW